MAGQAPEGALDRILYLVEFNPKVKAQLSEPHPADTPLASPTTPSAPAEPTRGTFAALRHRNYRYFYGGHLLSLVGGWMQITAMGWLVLELTDSAFWLGVVNAGASFPILIFSLFAGVLADRYDKRRILIVAQSVAFVQALILAVLTHTGLITVASIVFLVSVLGVANSFEIPTRQSFFVELVGQRDLSNAIALNSVAFNATRMVVPAIAGIVIAAVGVAACFYGNAISFLASIAGLLAIRRPAPEIMPATTSTWRNIREGLDWLRGDRVARTALLYSAAASVLVFPFSMLLPVFARDLLRIGPQGLGWLYSASGAGALLGGLTLASMVGRFPRGRLLLTAGTGFTLFVGMFALSTSVPAAIASLALAGFCMILSTATANSLVQSVVPDGLRGRVMSVYVVMFLGLTPIGSLVAGTAARLLNPRVSLASSAVAMLVVLGAVLWRSSDLRQLV
jgi:predicted MFS family arabinose efflux permease